MLGPIQYGALEALYIQLEEDLSSSYFRFEYVVEAAQGNDLLPDISGMWVRGYVRTQHRQHRAGRTVPSNVEFYLIRPIAECHPIGDRPVWVVFGKHKQLSVRSAQRFKRYNFSPISICPPRQRVLSCV